MYDLCNFSVYELYMIGYGYVSPLLKYLSYDFD